MFLHERHVSCLQLPVALERQHVDRTPDHQLRLLHISRGFRNWILRDSVLDQSRLAIRVHVCPHRRQECILHQPFLGPPRCRQYWQTRFDDDDWKLLAEQRRRAHREHHRSSRRRWICRSWWFSHPYLLHLLHGLRPIHPHFVRRTDHERHHLRVQDDKSSRRLNHRLHICLHLTAHEQRQHIPDRTHERTPRN